MRSYKDNESIIPRLVTSLLLVILIVIFILELIFFYLSYAEEIVMVFISFEYFYYLYLLIIIITIRTLILLYLAYSLLKEWKSQKIYSLTRFQYLFGLYFYLVGVVKSLDIIVYIMYVGPEFFSTELVLNLFRIRHIIAVLATLPLLLIGTYLFFYYRNLKKETSERKKMARKKVKIVLVIWVVCFMFIIFLSPSAISFLLTMMILSVVNLFIIWIFIKAHKGKILSEINCLTISIGFTVLFIIGYIPSFLIFTLLGTSVYGLLIGTLIVEIGGLVAYTIIFIGFKTKANY